MSCRGMHFALEDKDRPDPSGRRKTKKLRIEHVTDVIEEDPSAATGAENRQSLGRHPPIFVNGARSMAASIHSIT